MPPPTFTRCAAQTLSVVGHPGLLMPAAIVLAARAHGVSQQALGWAAGASLLVAMAVLAFSAAQVRAGRWRDVEASVPSERAELNAFAIPLLFGASAWVAWQGLPGVIAAGLAVGGSLVLLAHALRRWLKVSLHAGFAVFAASLLWAVPAMAAGGMVLALAVGWSRVALSRHSAAEVLTGWVVGGVAGVAFHAATAAAPL